MRFVFVIPTVAFDRDWSIGQAVFRPGGTVAEDVRSRSGQLDLHRSWAFQYEVSVNAVSEWGDSATVEADVDDVDIARETVSEAMAVLRLLLRRVLFGNLDAHRIGLVGEVDHAVREYLVLLDDDRVAHGFHRINGPVEFRFSNAMLDEWDLDPGLGWLSTQLALPPAERSPFGQRLINAIGVLDKAFLSQDPLVQVILYAVAVESLLADAPSSDKGMNGKSLNIGKRVAFLTCGAGCAASSPACPYVLGFNGRSHLITTTDEWAKHGEWRCSAFLDIAAPKGLDGMGEHQSLFGARNEAAHEGRTTLDEAGIRWMRSQAEGAVRAFLAWIGSHPDATIADLDNAIASGATEFGIRKPGST